MMIRLSFVWIELTAQSYNGFQSEVTGKGAAIVFIRGCRYSGDVWRETVEHLKDRCQCHILTLADYARVPPIGTLQRMRQTYYTFYATMKTTIHSLHL